MKKQRHMKRFLSLVTILAVLFSCTVMNVSAYEGDIKSVTTYVTSGTHANTNYYGQALKCGVNADGTESLAMTQFDVSGIKGTVTNATLKIGLNSPYDQIMACEIFGSWNAQTVTWNNKPLTAPYGNVGTEVAPHVVYIDVTQLVQKWISGENYGVALRGFQGSYNITNCELLVETKERETEKTMVLSGSHADSNYYGQPLQCGVNADGSEALALAYFNVSDIKGTVTSATLKIGLTSPYYQMMACEVYGDWDAQNVTWNNKPVVAPYGNTGTEVAPHVVYIDVTQLVQKWISGENYGVALRGFQGLNYITNCELLINAD